MGSSRETTVLYHQLLENPTGSMTKDETDKSTISKLSDHFLFSLRLPVYPMITSMTCLHHYLPERINELFYYDNFSVSHSTGCTPRDQKLRPI